jgi:hypothetical protein
MKTNIISLFGLILLMALNSCTDKDLELLTTQENSALYYKTDEQASKALIAAYDPIGWVWRQQSWGASLKTWGNFASDDAYTGGNDVNDQATYQAADTYTVTANDNGRNLIPMWNFYFMGINRANLILDNVADDTEYKKFARAHAQFLKGFYYFYLSRMFGGLPIYEKVGLPTDILPRATTDEVLAYVEKQLIEAISIGYLQERTSKKDPENGLATKASAQALLGKVYLYHKKYNEAIEALKPVAENPNYELEKEFWKIFKGNHRHGVESIFEINFADVIGGGNEGNSDIYLFGPRGSVTFNDTITSGWGFNQPTQNLVDAFNAQNDKVRLHATVFFSDTLQAWYNKTMKKETPISWVGAKDGFWDRKHYPDPANSTGIVYYRFINPDVVLRLADVFVMLAECYVRTNQTANAVVYINKVRERAKLPLLTNVSLVDVKNERRLELALEGERYFDLVRWIGDPDGIDADNVLGQLGYTEGTPGTTTNGLFPIPQEEINSSYGPNKLIQNPGYY